MRGLLLLLGLPAMAALGDAQALATPVPIAEWGPGLSTRPELLSRAFARAIFVPVDVDGDGDLDAVQLGSWDRSGLLTVTFNEGGGRFITRVMPPAHTNVWWMTWWLGAGDIDGDGDPDVVVPGAQLATVGTDRPWVHLNDGRGNFVLDNTRFPQSTRSRGNCVLCDVDRDGDLDVVFSGVPVTTILGQVEVWLNDGRGFFADASATHVPAGTYANFVAAGDLDGDGFPDLALGSYSGTSTEPKRILWNDGTGHFTVQRLPPVNYVDEVHLFDADGDGDLDVLFSGGFKFLYRNDGNRALTQAPFPNDNQSYAYGPASMGDIDADGDLDVVIAGTIFQPFILLNDGRGRFTESPAGSTARGSRASNGLRSRISTATATRTLWPFPSGSSAHGTARCSTTATAKSGVHPRWHAAASTRPRLLADRSRPSPSLRRFRGTRELKVAP